MQTLISFLILVILATTEQVTIGQVFQNLDFEQAQIVRVLTNSIRPYDFSPAFPGWSGFIGGEKQTFIDGPDGVPLSLQPYITLLASPTIPQGHWALSLGGGYSQLTGDYIPVSLSQTGQVPSNAKTIEYLGTRAFVSLGGQELDFVILQTYTNFYELWGADISAFAGQTVQLEISSAGGIDDIRFLPTGIPEPGVCGLILLTGAVFWRTRKPRQRARTLCVPISF